MKNKTFFYIAHQSFFQRVLVYLRSLHDFFYEWRANINTRGQAYRKTPMTLYGDGTRYKGTPCYILSKVFNRFRIGEGDVFADYGCGKGRVVCFAARFPFKKVIGLEADPEFIPLARRNAETVRHKKTSIEIVEGDAAHFNCREVTHFFYYNPFGKKTMESVLEKIHESLIVNPRKIQIVLYNPVQSDVFSQCSWLRKNEELGFQALVIHEATPRPYVEFYQNQVS